MKIVHILAVSYLTFKIALVLESFAAPSGYSHSLFYSTPFACTENYDPGWGRESYYLNQSHLKVKKNSLLMADDASQIWLSQF